MENYKNTDPATLISVIAKPRLASSAVISFVIHIVLLGLLSISFIGECFTYKSIHPAEVKKKLDKEKEEAEKQQRQAEAAKKAQLKAQQEKEEAEKKEKEQGKSAPAAPAPAAAAEKNAAPAAKNAAPADKKGTKEDPYANQTLPAEAATMGEAMDLP